MKAGGKKASLRLSPSVEVASPLRTTSSQPISAALPQPQSLPPVVPMKRLQQVAEEHRQAVEEHRKTPEGASLEKSLLLRLNSLVDRKLESFKRELVSLVSPTGPTGSAPVTSSRPAKSPAAVGSGEKRGKKKASSKMGPTVETVAVPVTRPSTVVAPPSKPAPTEREKVVGRKEKRREEVASSRALPTKTTKPPQAKAKAEEQARRAPEKSSQQDPLAPRR